MAWTAPRRADLIRPEVLRDALRAALVLALVCWALDLPVKLGLYLYTEQLIAFGLGVCATLALAASPPRGAVWAWINAAFALGVLGAFLYVAARYPVIQLDLAFAPAGAVALGLVMIAGVLEAVRRRTGLVLPVLLAALVGFALFVGPGLAPEYATRPVTGARLAVYLAFDANALFSKMLDIAVVTIAPFILFGVLLNAFGGAQAATAAVARLVSGCRGGAAKVAVLGSGLFGSVSGSAVANVAAVGAVTIPMMRRAGYSRPVAAGVEAVASTGGQLMPPIMGASAFLMAELLEMPYAQIALAATLPGLLFYASLLMAVDFEARRRPRAAVAEAPIGEDGDGDPDAAERVAASGGPPRWRHLPAVGVLVWLLFVEGRSPQQAGLLATALLIGLHVLWPAPGVLSRLRAAGRKLLDAMEQVADIVLLAAAAGLIIGVLNLTGISFAVTLQMLAAADGSMALLLAMTAGLCLVMGLGMPTVGVYILLAALAAPAIVQLGAPALSAHMFVFYFGMLSMITPPVAIASFAAATVARADPWATSFAAVRLAAGFYAIPIAFVNQPELLLTVSTDPAAAAFAALRALLAVALITAAAVGHVGRPLSHGVRLAALALAAPNLLAFGKGAPDGVLLAALVGGAALMLHAARPEAHGGATPYGSAHPPLRRP